MNKITQQLSAGLILCFFLLSCGADDVIDLLNTNSPLVGTTWTLSSETVSGCDDPSENGVENCTTNCETIVFGADGTLTTSEGVISYTSTATTITATYDDNGTTVSETIPYAIVLNQLTLTFGATTDDPCNVVEVYTGS